MEELAQMIAIAQSHMQSLKCPNTPKMGWTKEQGESVEQGIHDHGYLEVYKLTQEDMYGHDNNDRQDDQRARGLLRTWGDDLILPENVKFPIITAPTPLHLFVLRNSN